VSDKRPPDANATIQIDLSQIQLEDIELPGAAAPPSEAVRSVPPPLPPVLPIISVPPAAVEVGSGRTIVKVAIFAVLLIAAIAAGLLVGARVRGVPAAQDAPPVAS
jgi:hypothetical protein